MNDMTTQEGREPTVDVRTDGEINNANPPMATVAPKRTGAAPLQIIGGRHVRAIIPTSLNEVARLAAVIFDSRLAPYSFKNAQAVAVAIMYGAEVGLPPMQAMRSIAVINGKPTIYGDAGVAIVISSGDLETRKEYFKGELPSPIEFDEKGVPIFPDDYCAVVELRRKGNPDVTIVEYSVTDAKIARLWGKRGRPKEGETQGEVTPWITAPKRMLMWRARSFAFRDLFADHLGGMRFAEEAMDDDVIDEPVPIERPASVLTRLSPPNGDEARNGDTAHETINGKPEAVGDLEPGAAKQADDGMTDDERKLITDLSLALADCKKQKEIDVVAHDFLATIEHSAEGVRAQAMRLIATARQTISAPKTKKGGKPEAEPKLV